MSEKFSLKDHLFNQEKVSLLADCFSSVYDFPKETFVKEVCAGFSERELKERIVWIAENLKAILPQDYKKAVAVIIKALPEPLDPTKTDDDFGDFIFAPLSYFVSAYGCSSEYFDLSLQALYEITQRFSAEDAIRSFINLDPERTFEYLNVWASDPHYHVRRLVSEGTRPKLPWAIKIDTEYTYALPLLEKLYIDPTRYVTRSVANHLNDLAKQDPNLVIETLTRWKQSKQQEASEMEFLMKHSLRTLVTQGHTQALACLGYHQPASCVLCDFEIHTQTLRLGESLSFSCSFDAKAKEALIIHYVIWFVDAQGKPTRSKVFVLKKINSTQGEHYVFDKKHLFRAMTTRKHYKGLHYLDIVVNGERQARCEFTLEIN